MAIALEKCGEIKMNHWLKDNLSVANIVAGIAKLYINIKSIAKYLAKRRKQAQANSYGRQK